MISLLKSYPETVHCIGLGREKKGAFHRTMLCAGDYLAKIDSGRRGEGGEKRRNEMRKEWYLL